MIGFNREFFWGETAKGTKKLKEKQPGEKMREVNTDDGYRL